VKAARRDSAEQAAQQTGQGFLRDLFTRRTEEPERELV
jgi:hypothetical protein